MIIDQYFWAKLPGSCLSGASHQSAMQASFHLASRDAPCKNHALFYSIVF